MPKPSFPIFSKLASALASAALWSMLTIILGAGLSTAGVWQLLGAAWGLIAAGGFCLAIGAVLLRGLRGA